MGHIFISYSHKDKEYVHELHDALLNEGFNVWIDDRIDYGDRWLKVIERNLDECDAFIIVMSKNSSESEMVQNEITRARDLEKQIFPLLLDGKNWLVVQSKQFVDVRDGSLPSEKFYKRLESVTERKNQKAEREAAERLAQEKASRERAEKEAAEKADRERIAKVARENLERERKERLATQIAALRETLSQAFVTIKSNLRKAIPFLRIAGFAGITIALFWIGSWGIPRLALFAPNISATLSPTRLPSETVTLTAQLPTKIFTPMPTSTITETPAPTAVPTEITDAKGVTMRLVPVGEFTMGNNSFPIAAPEHMVYLDSFYLDKFEVTNALYETCEKAGVCTTPKETGNQNAPEYYGNLQFADYPVVDVDWYQAKAYCEWRGGRLPTEAQWEKAARGTDSRREYPWGYSFQCNIAVSGDCTRFISPVVSHESGVSPFGIYNLAGNVWEWVNDWYSETYYKNSLPSNPSGPDSGQYRVLRGGSWNNSSKYLTVYHRGKNSPGGFHDSIGFRCAVDANP